jgi:hypothetical protein
MAVHLLQTELRDIGQEIIRESEKEVPDVIRLKAKIDDLALLIELIKRDSKEKIFSPRLFSN